MTGFGRVEEQVDAYTVTVELKSLNGKGFDLNTRLPSALRPYETELRTVLSGLLSRGTADMGITMRTGGSSRPMRINTELAIHYYKGVQELAQTLNLPTTSILDTLLRLPEVVSAEAEVLPDGVWPAIRSLVLQAAEDLIRHRKTEGAVLEADLRARIAAISAGLDRILPLEGLRSARIKERLSHSLHEAVGPDKVDANRFEQELIYYLERLDFSEEKIRLSQHCAYFLTLLDDEELSKGKRLGFVLQEIGREINTLGSKASDAAIQQIVVGMKDELEKAKEQVLNIL